MLHVIRPTLKSRESLSHSHEHFHNFKELAPCLHERSLPSPTLHTVLSGPTNSIPHSGKLASPFFLILPIDIESQSHQPSFLLLNLNLNRVPFAHGVLLVVIISPTLARKKHFRIPRNPETQLSRPLALSAHWITLPA